MSQESGAANLRPPLFNSAIPQAPLFQKVSLRKHVSEGDALASTFITDQVTGLRRAVVDIWGPVCVPAARLRDT